MHTFLFYDIETTGLSRAFDQVIQFAAVRTDLNFNELSRSEIRVRLNPDVIPSPTALLTHGIGIDAMQQGIAEYEAICQIHALFNTPGTISLGYNSLGFDDEFLRFAFYRHLLPPYTHQYANQCSRRDLYPIAQMYYLFKPDCLQWPTLNQKISLKLEQLNAANALAAGRAHDAMSDVEATLALAQRFASEKTMWDYLQGYFRKETDLDRTHLMQTTQTPALFINGKLGANNAFQCPVIFLGQHKHYKNQQIWLRLDTAAFNNADTASSRCFNKKLGEPNFILPFQARFLHHLSDERRALAAENLQWLHAHPSALKNMTDTHIHYQYPVFADADVEARLYMNGFLSASENDFCQQFHAARPTEKATLAQHAPTDALKTLTTRLLARNFPATLTAEMTDIYHEFCARLQHEADAPIDYQGKKHYTVATALAEIATLRQPGDLSTAQVTLLTEYEAYLLSLRNT